MKWIGYALAWILYTAGDLVSKPVYAFDGTFGDERQESPAWWRFLWWLYQTLMGWSTRVDDFFGADFWQRCDDDDD